ncbi:MAG: aminotransferase class V-fold PLP-dependent enzyme, partial [Thermoplasmatales archaeon]|nr:aminotransferase class V-fold PLP-dependent enzyme [Thermoplasmatales archaeon]
MEGIYLDHASSMPVDPRVINFAKPFLAEAGNPSSLYEFGQTAKQAVKEARRKVVDLINAESE